MWSEGANRALGCKIGIENDQNATTFKFLLLHHPH